MNKLRFMFKSFNLNQIPVMISRNRGQAMTAIFLRLIVAIGGSLSKGKVYSIQYMLSKISKIARAQGLPGLAKYLKTCCVLIQQYLGGYYVSDISSIGPRVSRTKSGLPRILPRSVRQGIVRGQAFWARFSLTILSLFRVLKYPGTLKISTITKPFTGRSDTIHEIIGFIPYFVKVFIRKPGRHLLGPMKIGPISKSSPNTKFDMDADPSATQPMDMSTAPLAMLLSLRALSPEQINSIFTLSYLDDSVGARLRALITSTGSPATINQGKVYLKGRWKSMTKFPLRTGKLGLKEEAAGKVRLFAMVDPFTQFVMSPLHFGIFKILKRYHYIDGTFNQLAPLKRAWGYKSLFSMDLSSATDRLPISIQTPLIQQVFHLTLDESKAWEHLLIGREYWLPGNKFTGDNPLPLTYSVGQPMGALSSWAMLALVHHLIVQFAAVRCKATSNGKLFTAYAVLGDDIVIYHPRVAKAYHKILSGLGVECNLAKSIMSSKGTALEFAKKTIWNGIDVSPIPLSEFHSAMSSPTMLAEFAKVHKLNFSKALKVAGFGYKVLGGLNRPLMKQNLKVRYFMMVSWIYDPALLLKSFQSLLPWASVPQLCQYFAEFYSGYLTILLTKVKDIRHRLNLSVLWGQTLTDESKVRPWYARPGPDSLLVQPQDLKTKLFFLYESVYGSYRKRFEKLCNEIRYYILDYRGVIRQIYDMPKDSNQLLSWVKLGIMISRLETRFSSLSIRTMQLSSITPGWTSDPKIFKTHSAFLNILSKMSDNKEESILLTPIDPNSKFLQSSFLGPVFVKAVPIILKSFNRISKSFIQNFSFKYILFNRIKWLISWTGILSVLSWNFGLEEVITCVLGIWSLLATIVSGTMTTGSWFDYLWFYAINFAIHSFELLISAVILVNIIKWETTWSVLDILWQNYDSRITSLWDCFRCFFNYQSRLLHDVAFSNITDAATYVSQSLTCAPYSINILCGMIATLIGTWILRWLFGI